MQEGQCGVSQRAYLCMREATVTRDFPAWYGSRHMLSLSDSATTPESIARDMCTYHLGFFGRWGFQGSAWNPMCNKHEKDCLFWHQAVKLMKNTAQLRKLQRTAQAISSAEPWKAAYQSPRVTKVAQPVGPATTAHECFRGVTCNQ